VTSRDKKRPYREPIYLGKFRIHMRAQIYPHETSDQVFLIHGSVQLCYGRESQALTAKAFTHSAMHLADTRVQIMLEQL